MIKLSAMTRLFKKSGVRSGDDGKKPMPALALGTERRSPALVSDPNYDGTPSSNSGTGAEGSTRREPRREPRERSREAGGTNGGRV